MNTTEPAFSSPHAYFIRELVRLLPRETLGEAGRLCIALAQFIATEPVVRAMKYGAQFCIDSDGSEGAGCYEFAEAFEVADAVLRARIAIDLLWSKFDADTYGKLGNAIVEADELLAPHADALRMVPESLWKSLTDAGETFDTGGWWEEMYVTIRRDKAAWEASSDEWEAARRNREDADQS